MKCTGILKAPSIDFTTGKIILSVQVNEDVRNKFDQLMKCEKLDIEIKKHREKRSLNANAYFHVLVGKIADVLGISKQRAKNILISRYGQMEMIDDEPLVYKTNAPVSYMLELEDIHTSCIGHKNEDGKELNFYRVYRGSHTYDTKEMSVLIDGTVQEARDLGIETMTPAELERMVQAWQRS